MKIAGFGFRKTAGIESLRSALLAAGGVDGVVALATAAEKAEAPPLIALAAELHLPIRAIASGEIRFHFGEAALLLLPISAEIRRSS